MIRERSSTCSDRCHRPDFRVMWRESAEAVFGSVSCDTLKFTRRLAALVFDVQLRAASAPQRVGLRATLSSIAELAEKLSKLLSDPGVLAFARELPDVLASHGTEGTAALARVARLARRKSDLLPRGPGRGGADSALGLPTPQLQCAACIAEVWQRRGRAVSNRDEKARAACVALWRLADGPVSRKVNDGADAAEMWDRHLRTVAHKLESEPQRRRRRGEQVRLGGEAARAAAVDHARECARAALGSFRRQNSPSNR
jgi:hypothetical protein